MFHNTDVVTLTFDLLTVPPWVGAVSTGDGFSHRWGRNSEEFCVAVGPVTRTAGILI